MPVAPRPPGWHAGPVSAAATLTRRALPVLLGLVGVLLLCAGGLAAVASSSDAASGGRAASRHAAKHPAGTHPAARHSAATGHAARRVPATASTTGTAAAAPPAAAATPAGPLRVVSLGDSVPAGTACDCVPYASLYGRVLAERGHRTVTVTNDAVAGLTSAGLLASLSEPSTAADVAAADVVTVTIGANDFAQRACTWTGTPGSCYADTLASLRANLTRTLTRIAQLRGHRPTTVVLTGYWDVWKDGAVARRLGSAYVRVADTLTRLANAVISDVAHQEGAGYVDLYLPFKGPGDVDDTDLLAPDGDHPNQSGHALIAQSLLTIGAGPLRDTP